MSTRIKALELAKDLSQRSIIKIKVGAVIFNKNEILSWGWNNPGNGLGDHAEHMAIRRLVRSNNLRGASDLRIAVYSTRKGKTITSRPCSNCERLLRRFGIRGSVYYRKEEAEGRFLTYLVDESYV